MLSQYSSQDMAVLVFVDRSVLQFVTLISNIWELFLTVTLLQMNFVQLYEKYSRCVSLASLHQISSMDEFELSMHMQSAVEIQPCAYIELFGHTISTNIPVTFSESDGVRYSLA